MSSSTWARACWSLLVWGCILWMPMVVPEFSRMRSRRVPVLRLGSRGPGGDARSLRCVRKAFARRSQSVRSRSQSFAEGRTCRRVHRVQNRRETQNCRHFLRFALQKCQQSQGSGGSWSRNPELSSLLDSSRVSASEKRQQSQGSGVSWSRNPELSSLLDSSCLFASESVNSHKDRGGRHFWTCLVSSRLKSVNSHRDRGFVVAKPRTVVTFGLVSGVRV